MTRRRPSMHTFICVISLSAVVFTSHPTTVLCAEAPICGRLCEIDGVRVLHLWGSSHERGYAHGYLLGEDILRLFDGYLKEVIRKEDALREFEQAARTRLRAMNIPRRYADELRGMLTGIQTRLGEKARLAAFDRLIEYDDLVAINCIPELGRVCCSSFAAWGPMTTDGGTISGRNLDWHRLRTLRGTHLIIAYCDDAPNEAEISEQHSSLGWVSVTWPGFIGCLTGMNADGVTVSMHDAPGPRPTAPLGFTPRGLALRLAIESACGSTAYEDVRRVLSAHLAAVGNNVPVTFPSMRNKAAAVVFEYDGDLKNNMGLTVRLPDGTGRKKSAPDAATAFLTCTNHYVKRAAPTACDRYSRIDQRLASLAGNGKPVDLPEAWSILRSVACRVGPGQPLETYHSVVFEPNRRVMHVAFSSADKPAADNPPIRLDVAQLLEVQKVSASR